MKNLIKEMDFISLKDNFDTVCDNVNDSSATVALNLKSGRRVFIIPEENYDNISRFVIRKVSTNTLTK